MTVISSITDATKLTLVNVVEFDATPEQVWEVWENPRVLERWWGPPTFPATFTRHEFAVNGQSRFYMTGPAGERPCGWWHIIDLDRPNRIEFSDGLAGVDGEPEPDEKPMHCVVTLEPFAGGTRMTVYVRFATVDQMEKMLEMGMREGMAQALGQIDALLDGDAVRR